MGGAALDEAVFMEPWQVMKGGITPAQRRRLGDHSLIVAMDPATKRLLRYEEVASPNSYCLGLKCIQCSREGTYREIQEPPPHSLLHNLVLER